MHDYCATYPICWDARARTSVRCAGFGPASGAVYRNPGGAVHVTEGNGGVPGVSGTYAVKSCATSGKPWCRTHGTGGAYGRIVAHNSTHLTYEHVQNNGGEVTDVWTIVQTKHGPFA